MQLPLIRSSLLWQWLLLAIAAPFLVFPAPARTPAMLLILALWGIGWLADREAFPRTPLTPALLLLSFMVLVSMWATYDLLQSLSKITGVLLGIGAFSILARHRKRPDVWWVGLGLFLATGVAIAGISLVSMRWTAKISVLVPIVNLMPGPLISLPGLEGAINPNEVGGAMTWVVPPALCLAALVAMRWRALQAKLGTTIGSLVALLVLLAAGIVTMILILTQSRSAYLGLGIAGAVMVFFALPKRGRIALLLVGILTGIGVGIAVWSYGPETIVQPLFEQSGDPLNSLDGRLEIWSRALYGIQDFVFTGMGMNTFREVVHILYPLFLISPNTDIAHAHNEFLQAALDLGVPGLIAFVALYFGTFGMLSSIWNDTTGTESEEGFLDATTVRMVVLGFGGGLLAHIIYGLTDAVALGAKPGILFWMLLGLVAGLYGQNTVRAMRLSGHDTSITDTEDLK